MKKTKIAIIGCGNNGLGHLKILKDIEGVEITAIVDPMVENLRSTEIPEVRRYKDYKEMFKNETLDAVCISTPHKFHYEQAMAAFEHNCHVLLEKPMALTEKDSRQLVKMAGEKKLILQIGFECRQSSMFIRIKEIIDSGEIGELLSISYRHYRGTWMRDWYCKRDLGGGSMTVIETCHYIDLMRFWSGKDVEWVFASSPKANFRAEYEYPDTSYCQMGFHGGMIANIEESHALSCDCFMDTGKSYGTGEGEWMDPVYGHRFEYSIVGSKGALYIRMIEKQISVLEMKSSYSGKRPKLSLKRIEDYSKVSLRELTHDHSFQDRSFVKAVQNNVPPPISSEDALKSHLAVFAIEKSESKSEKIYLKE
jgi:predicted dehydrogenase